jgi:Calcineurin-like phosphoesterase
MVIATLVTFLVINPLYLLWRWPTRRVERRAWTWYLKPASNARTTWTRRTVYWLLSWRMALAVRMRATRYSIPAAITLGLARGLPVAAVIAATVPVWGMSWFFDTENYASAVWNSWAESRTDTWRQAMVRAVAPADLASSDAFTLSPPGISGDFSFVVIGDTGEGDASQHVLRDQLLTVTAHEAVKFLVISSDVVYPNGEMHDYEDKFWLPFKGITKPVYAIPGNHDWYDALEAFSATFFDPAAARLSIRARVEADLRVSSTTNGRIDSLIREAGRLRSEYRVPTGSQRAPFFEVQNDQFALIAVDTGVLKRIDPAESEWLQGALTRARGKFTMVILGHPFFAAGANVTSDNKEFAHLKARLRDHGVSIVMAGDTHDLEYYEEATRVGESPVHHFVNGGGGAYLSFGTPLAWPETPPTPKWAHYPGKDAVVAKIETTTPWWKWPAWWWTRHMDGWPFSVEFMSAIFDVNGAPFFQSFLEVHVESSQRRVRILPYGVHGPLTWGVLSVAAGLRPPGATDQTPVEWIIPMATAR